MIWDRTNHPVWFRCTAGVLVAVIAAAVRSHFPGILELRVAFVTFYPAVVVAALYGGLSTGLPATVVSGALADYFWIEPVGQFAIANIADQISLVVFLASGIMISCLAEATYRAQARAHKAEGQARLAAEREKAAELLQLQAEMFRLSYDAIIVWQFGGPIESWNKGAEELYGYSQEEALGRVTQDLLKTIHPEPRTQIEAKLRECTFWEGELKHRTREGQEVIVSTRLQLVHGADGVTRVLETNRDITERKRTYEALRESQAKLKEVHRLARIGVWDWIVETDTVHWSEELYDIAGRDRRLPAPSYREHAEIYAPQSWALLKSAVERALASCEPYQLELKLIRPDGAIRWVNAFGGCKRGGDQRVIGFYGTVQDITERKLAEEQARELFATVQEERDRLSALINSMDDEIWFADSKKKLTLANPSALRKFGFSESPDDLDIEKFAAGLEILCPDGSPRPVEEAPPLRALKGEVVRNSEEIVRIPASGELRHRQANAAPVKDSNDNVIGVVSVVRDITELKRAEDALRQSEQRFRTIYERAPIGIALVDIVNGKFVEINSKYCEIAGRTREEMLGLNFREITHPDDLQPNLDSVALLLGGKIDFFNMEKRYLRPDDSIVWVNLIVGSMWEEGKTRRLHLAIVEDITDQKRAKASLRESEERLRIFIEHAPASLAMFDREMRYLSASRRWNSDYRLGEADLIGLSHYEIFPEIPEYWKKVHRRALAGEVVRADSDLFERADGSAQWVRWEVRPWRDSTGDVAGIVIFNEDVTERKLAEEALRESEEKFFSVFKHAPMMAAISVMEDGTYLDVNDKFLEASGFRREEILGKTSIEVGWVRSEDRQRLIDTLQEQGKISGKEITSYTKVGRPVDCSYHCELVTIGGVKRLLTMTLDITERKRAEEELISEKQKFEQLADNIDLIFCSVDLHEGEILYVNKAFEKVFGRGIESIGSKPDDWLETIYHEDRLMIEARIKRVRFASHDNVEFRIIRPDGSLRWLRAKTTPVRDEKGEVYRIAGIAEDITEEKRLRQEAEYRLEQLIQADKLASLGELVAGIAHEINNPNSFISYNLPLLEDTWEMFEPIIRDYSESHPEWRNGRLTLPKLSKDMAGIIHAIQEGSERINRVVGNLKDFARLDESGLKKPVQVNEVVQKTLTIVGAQLRKSLARFDLRLSEDLPLISGHFYKLEQVLANLLLNANHAVLEKEGGIVTLTTRYVERLGCVLIEIEDNGNGMQRDVLDRIFDPFFTTRRTSGGTGLGLSVSHGLVQEHRGRIAVLSRLGLGSRFTVYLPLDESIEVDLKPNIVVVDDDPLVLTFMTKRFTRSQEGTETFDDPTKVLQYIEEHPETDIVITDLRMPEFSGWDLLKRIKARFPLLPVIVCSGDSLLSEKPEDVPEPDYSFLKPVNFTELTGAINSLGRQKL
ncbi:MAG: PAS domain S-box protein [Syntrophobacteraceae bacterium]|nr:PAS domain S-box protein [Syntrophobacteraceae bacterium]